MSGLVKLSALAGLAIAAGGATALAQAPSSAQVWDIRMVVDETGPYAPGLNATQVGITIMARVGILPNTSASGTNNFGVSRIGGAGTATSGFRVIYLDPESAAAGLGNGRVSQGLTADIDGRSLLDTNGNALAGHFAPFRGSATPQVGPLFLGSNSDAGNGQVGAGANQNRLFNVVGSRQFNYGSDGSGPQGAAIAVDSNPESLIGDLAPVYRMYYFPVAGGPREITIQTLGVTGRYITQVIGSLATSGGNTPYEVGEAVFPLGRFVIPSPGAGALVVLVGLAALRRRR